MQKLFFFIFSLLLMFFQCAFFSSNRSRGHSRKITNRSKTKEQRNNSNDLDLKVIKKQTDATESLRGFNNLFSQVSKTVNKKETSFLVFDSKSPYNFKPINESNRAENNIIIKDLENELVVIKNDTENKQKKKKKKNIQDIKKSQKDTNSNKEKNGIQLFDFFISVSWHPELEKLKRQEKSEDKIINKKLRSNFKLFYGKAKQGISQKKGSVSLAYDLNILNIHLAFQIKENSSFNFFFHLKANPQLDGIKVIPNNIKPAFWLLYEGKNNDGSIILINYKNLAEDFTEFLGTYQKNNFYKEFTQPTPHKPIDNFSLFFLNGAKSFLFYMFLGKDTEEEKSLVGTIGSYLKLCSAANLMFFVGPIYLSHDGQSVDIVTYKIDGKKLVTGLYLFGSYRNNLYSLGGLYDLNSESFSIVTEYKRKIEFTKNIALKIGPKITFNLKTTNIKEKGAIFNFDAELKTTSSYNFITENKTTFDSEWAIF